MTNLDAVQSWGDKADKQKPSVGLKRLRKVSGKSPTYHCDNCNCDRYTECGCMRKHG